MLDNYLESLVTNYGNLRLGKLLGKEQTGREQVSAPSLSLRQIYTSLATNQWIRLENFNLPGESIAMEMDVHNPHENLPDYVRVAQIHLTTKHTNLFDSSYGSLTLQWERSLRQLRNDPETRSGTWYRPELAVEAVAMQPRLVLLGGPGSGKSTALRYLILMLAEALLAGSSRLELHGWDNVSILPIPLFCQLGQVAKKLGDNPSSDVQTLITALLTPVEGIGVREDIRATMIHAWRTGSSLLCFDGMDEVSATPEPTSDRRRSRRERVVEAIHQFANQIGPARIVVTCRTKPYELDTTWRFDDSWTVRMLEPFSLGQVHHFVLRWYEHSSVTPQAKYTGAEATNKAYDLIDILENRLDLQALTTSPLLLTMLTLLHYNSKRLSEERADVYEEMVELLLDRWEGVRSSDIDRRVESIGERLGLPRLTSTDLRPVIREIAFEAHRQPVTSRGVLPGNLLRTKLDAFFARTINAKDPRKVKREEIVAKTDRFIEILREETGLLQEEGDETYVLLHLTLEEYLAACHLSGREDPALAYEQWRTTGERWREALLLMMGRLLRQEKLALAYSWLDLLIAERCGTELKSIEQRQRDTVLAAICYNALGRRQHLAGRALDVIGLEDRLRAMLADLLAGAANTSASRPAIGATYSPTPIALVDGKPTSQRRISH